jgi:hypothetical protein
MVSIPFCRDDFTDSTFLLAIQRHSKPRRRNVPCECSACGGIKHVPQETRRVHLQRDRTQWAAALAELNQTPSAEDHDDNTHLGHGEDAIQSNGVQTVDPANDIDDSNILEDAHIERAEAGLANADQPLLDPLMDDNWEEVGVIQYAQEDEPLPPEPLPPPPPVIPSHPAVSHPTPPVAIGVPEHKHAENTPDPFWKPDMFDPAPPHSFEDVHPNPGVYLLYMLVTWLHLQFHLPFRACTAAMNVFMVILQVFGTTLNPTPITSLPRIMSKLDVEPTFDILPVCSSCLEVYPSGDSTPSICTRCNAFMFKPSLNGKNVPLLQFPSKSIKSQLVSLLAVPGVEEALDAWRHLPRRRGEYMDVFDGEIPKNLPDPDGLPFFRNGPHDKPKGPNGELRIALTLGVDW